MIGFFARKISYQRSAIVLAGVCVAGLYASVAIDRLADSTVAGPTLAEAPAGKQLSTAYLEPAPLLTKPLQISMVGSAEQLFNLIGYRLDGVRAHGKVPRVFLASLPSGLPKIRLAAKRKVLFIKTALPLILHVNELIQHDREEIQALYAKQQDGGRLSESEMSWLQEKAETYGIAKVDFGELLRRVDIIPPSLALAQSAEESGWGTSRFAQKGNALFGQRTFKKNKGIVPKRRAKGETYRVRAFDHLIDGVKSYAHNLNTHAAYRKFRAARSRLQRDGKALNGYRLAETLTAYSERGAAYIKTLKSLIRVNGFGEFDKVRLGDRVSIDRVRPGA
ncbi:MAG: glucosaminidase domain-containing protein [Alphaproteobacteria bacterium]